MYCIVLYHPILYVVRGYVWWWRGSIGHSQQYLFATSLDAQSMFVFNNNGVLLDSHWIEYSLKDALPQTEWSDLVINSLICWICMINHHHHGISCGVMNGKHQTGPLGRSCGCYNWVEPLQRLTSALKLIQGRAKKHTKRKVSFLS